MVLTLILLLLVLISILYVLSLSVCEVLQLSAIVLHRVNVICKVQVAQGSPTNGDGGAVVVESFSYDVFQKDVKQHK